MSITQVLYLDDYRDRREQRLRLADSLYRADPLRHALLPHLRRVAELAGADRVATVWVDEYGPGLVHAHVVLDLLSDRPRRSYPVEPLRRAWDDGGVPGFYDGARDARSDSDAETDLFAVALGSDGTRAWFVVGDRVAGRPALAEEIRDEIMFLAGECSAVVLHGDLDAMRQPGSEERPRFAGWPILRDMEDFEEDEAESQRIALRFVVARLPRLLVDDDLASDPERLRQQAQRAREEIEGQAPGALGTEGRLWNSVLDALQESNLEALGAALLSLGRAVEARDQHHGASELYQMAYEISTATGNAERAIDAARFSGRVFRRLARWGEAFRWYGIARGVAEAMERSGSVAVVLDGVANIHRDRGNLPAARQTLQEALAFAERSGEATAMGRIFHGFLALEHMAGNLDEAVGYGWKAIQTYPADEDRVQALASLAGALQEGEQLGAAEDAWMLVAHQASDRYYRIYAWDALSHIAALNGDEASFRTRASRADALGWEEGSRSAKAEILYYRGLSYRALEDREAARRWLERAVSFAEAHGFNQILFKAEEALENPGRYPEETGRGTPRKAPPAAVLEVRAGLRRMREEEVGAMA